jgi:hypothetical protein
MRTHTVLKTIEEMDSEAPYLSIRRQREEVAMDATKEVRLVVRQMQVLLKQAQVEGTVVELVPFFSVVGRRNKLARVCRILELLRLKHKRTD